MTYRVYVRCPQCGNEQMTKSFLRKSCVYCGYSFTIFPKNKKSRVSKVIGNFDEYIKDVKKYLERR